MHGSIHPTKWARGSLQVKARLCVDEYLLASNLEPFVSCFLYDILVFLNVAQKDL